VERRDAGVLDTATRPPSGSLLPSASQALAGAASVRIIFVNNFGHVTGGADEHCLRLARERVLRARRRFDRRRGSEKTWVYSIALNLLRDEARRRAAEGRAVERTELATAERELRPERALEGVRCGRASAGPAERGGARGDRAALRGRSDRPRDRQGDR
jgi:hypothetical protein